MNAIGLMNTTFRNADGQLGGTFDILYQQLPPFPQFTNPNPTPAYQTPTYSTPPTFSNNAGDSSFGAKTSLNLNTIFQGGLGLASQFVSAFGKRDTQQITGSSSVQALVAPQPSTGYNPQTTGLSPAQLAQQQAALLAQQQAGAAKNLYGAGTGVLDSLASSFGISTTTLLLGGAVAVALYLRQPKKR